MRRAMVAAVAMVVLLTACASTATSTDASTPMPTCRRSVPFRSRQIAALAVDADGHVCWETALFTPPI